MIVLLCSIAHATSTFDATAPVWESTGAETFTQDGTTKLWSRLERWHDPNPTLFGSREYTDAAAWHDLSFSPWIATAFGSSRPVTGSFLLHTGPSELVAHGTPILFVPGAGDNGSRGFITMAIHQDRLNRPVYALTFAHPHGDVFEQAEVIADAIAVIKQKTGAPLVDVVAHSKGGISAVVYASNSAATDWGSTPSATTYEQVGTRYREDVRNLVLIATPLGGIDTAYRWTANNLFALDTATTLAPSSWSTYYPSTTVFPLVSTDLRDQDFLPDSAHMDPFPGQRQLLARQSPALPWTMSWLGGYATAQIDNYTTYEGGLGLYSSSDGIDDAIAAGGDLIAHLRDVGVDPNVAVWLLAGTNPLMPNGDAALAAMWEDMGISEDDWASLLADISAHDVPVAADEDELDGLQRGMLVLGEVTGVSDGLVFETSGRDERAITRRGARIAGSKSANLSHLDLLYASPITGQLLIDSANDGAAADAWMRGVGKRYKEEDTIGWVEDALADEVIPDTDDTGVVDTDTGHDTDTDTGRPFARPCGGCSTGRDGAVGLGVAGLVLLAGRRRRLG